MDDRFTGGDGLQPGTFAHQLHLGLMANELSRGRGAYRMANAVAGSSGPSFGPFQYDLGANAHGRGLIERIALHAVDGRGQRILDDRGVAVLQKVGYQPFRTMEPADRQAYEALKPRLNRMLSSAAGRRLVDMDYAEHLERSVAAVDAVVANVPKARNREFLQRSPLARLIIADTSNQFGTAVNTGLRTLLAMDATSPHLRIPGRRHPASLGVRGELGLEELVRYKLETEYAQTLPGARDTLRRIVNLVGAVGVDNIALSAEDRKFFRTGLCEQLRRNGIDPGFVEHDPSFAALRSLGNMSVERMIPARTDEHGQRGSGGRHPSGPTETVSGDASLRHGEHGAEVWRLQARLNAHGIRDAHGRALPLTGNYLDRTQAAVAEFQRTHALPVTGVADPGTRAALARSPEVRYGQQGAAVTHVQQMLHAAGHEVPVNGRFSDQTEGAVKDFQLAQGLAPTGIVAGETLYRLRQAERQHGPMAVVDRAVAVPERTTGPVLLSGPAHPDHALFAQALQGVHRLDAAHRRTADMHSTNAAGALAAAGRDAGLERIDHVVPGEGGSRLFAVQGALDSPAKRMAWVDTVQAIAQPVEVSTQRIGATAPGRVDVGAPIAVPVPELRPLARAH